ncbi:MAG: LLM class flavin-dependent oxidoreductase [Firmicutes bacterium]|nr:LLM class flavin-dependent oxidoreductase [Bacillota bacterium]
MAVEFGLLLPHFGLLAKRERVIDQAPQLEEWGFDAVFVRDHLTFQPHAFEGKSTTFYEPFTTLTAVAALTRRLKVGTATVIPFRHALVTSQLFGGVSMVAGPGRLIVGVGAGTPQKPFDATGFPFEKRFQAVREMVDIFRLTWSQEHVSYQGEVYRFEDVTIDPHPPADTPIWYGGASSLAIQRALEYADGWFPGRLPFTAFERMSKRFRRGAEGIGRPMRLGIIPNFSIDVNRQTALQKVEASLPGMFEEARRKNWKGLSFETVDDIEGMIIYGSPADCVRGVQRLIDLGADHVVFDLRLRPEEYDEQLKLVATEVLPALRERNAAVAS